jgi:hypothetical protein
MAQLFSFSMFYRIGIQAVPNFYKKRLSVYLISPFGCKSLYQGLSFQETKEYNMLELLVKLDLMTMHIMSIGNVPNSYYFDGIPVLCFTCRIFYIYCCLQTKQLIHYAFISTSIYFQIKIARTIVINWTSVNSLIIMVSQRITAT